MADLQILAVAGDIGEVSVDASATTFLAGYLLANDGAGAWVLADADVAARQDAQWICLDSVRAGAGTSTFTMKVAKRVYARDRDASAYTAGALLFLSATAGAHTATRPTIANATMQRVVGKAVTANEIVLNVAVPHYHFSYTFGANAEAVDSVLMVAQRPMRLLEAKESHITAGSDAGAVTLQVTKSASGVSVVGGTAMLTTTFNMKSTASTVVSLGATTTAADARVATSDQVGADFTGTTTALVGVGLSLVFVDEQAI